MFSTQISHDSVPQALGYIIEKLEKLEQDVGRMGSSSTVPADVWLNADELSEYLPQHPARQTIYSWTSTKQIPYHKNGKSIIFRKSEIDAWLLHGSVKTTADLAAEAKAYVAAKKKGVRR